MDNKFFAFFLNISFYFFIECSEQNLKGRYLNESESNTGITIEMVLVDTRGDPHEKRRRVKWSWREKIGTELLNKKTAVWFNEAGENMDFGTAFPLVGSKTSHGNLNKKRLQKMRILISPLRQIKNNSEYASSIKKLLMTSSVWCTGPHLKYTITKILWGIDKSISTQWEPLQNQFGMLMEN